MESTTTSLHAVPREPSTTMATAMEGVFTMVASAVQETVPALSPQGHSWSWVQHASEVLKTRKEKKDYTFQCQFDEKPKIIPCCPKLRSFGMGTACGLRVQDCWARSPVMGFRV